MNTWWIAATVLVAVPPEVREQQLAVPVFESNIDLTPQGKVDRLVFSQLRKSRIDPAHICSDAVFVRRVYLDVIGTLPTADEAGRFLLDRSPRKRRDLVDHLLEREEFADYWAMKWADLLRVKSEFPINLWPNAVQAYHRWIRTCIKENMPYDQFAREILTASGSNFRVPQVNFYRAAQSAEPSAIAQAVSLTFMGVRAEGWTNGELAGMATFFSQIGHKTTREWKEEIIFFDSLMARSVVADDLSRVAFLPDGTQVQLSPQEDPREVFADWLITPTNPWFTRNIVNRIWYWLLGRGMIHEPDDIRPDNPPRNPQLLELLQRELVGAGYDLKHLYRLILNSKTYQLSSIPRTNQPEGAMDFAYYPMRRLDAEVLIDALCQVTGTTEEYSSPIPEPFTFIPEDQRSISLADGSITSPFLELFGRPPRDTGLASERNNRPTGAQRLHLLNSSHIQRKIERSQTLRELARSSRNPLETATKLYLTILSRFPTQAELQTVHEYLQSGEVNRQQAFVDLAWALINNPEFFCRH